LIVPVLVRVLLPAPLITTPGPPVPVICPSLAMFPGPVKLTPRTPWMIAPELLLTCPPPPRTSASPPPTLSWAPDSMLTVTLVLPGCETIAVVTGFGGLVSQVTVCPVVGVTVGVQAARTGSTDEQSAAVASAKIDAVEHKLARTCSGALSTCRGTKRFDEDADRIIDLSRPGIRKAEGSRFETTHRSTAQLTIAMQMRCRGRAVGLSLTVAERARQYSGTLRIIVAEKWQRSSRTCPLCGR